MTVTSPTRKPPREPAERAHTVREAIAAELREGSFSAHELSARVSVEEREVAAHLQHLERSLKHSGERLSVLPPRCLKCGFVFVDRERLRKPSRCPECKSERLSPARFSIAGR